MPPAKASSPRVALLRGIQVGGRNKQPMADRVTIFEDVGCRDVQTCIQSGNVVFQASPLRDSTTVLRLADMV